MYGRTRELVRLNKDRNDHSLHKVVRGRANEAYKKIVAQMQDKKLMSLRLRLIGASKAHNLKLEHKIQMQMRDHLKQNMETGQ